jgi:hypothetical protein
MIKLKPILVFNVLEEFLLEASFDCLYAMVGKRREGEAQMARATLVRPQKNPLLLLFYAIRNCSTLGWSSPFFCIQGRFNWFGSKVPGDPSPSPDCVDQSSSIRSVFQFAKKFS